MPGQSFDDTNAFHRTMRSFAATKVGAALLRPTARHLDRLVTKVTGGRSSFTGITTGIPAVMLTTTGAKSREPRTVAVFGIPHPDGLGLIASNWGGEKHPAWVLQSQGESGRHGDDGARYVAWHCPPRHSPGTRRDLGEGPQGLSRLAEVRKAGRWPPHRGVRRQPGLTSRLSRRARGVALCAPADMDSASGPDADAHRRRWRRKVLRQGRIGARWRNVGVDRIGNVGAPAD